MLPDVLGEDAFADWVQEYAGAEESLGESMRDDAAFENEIDCAAPHSLELHAIAELPKALAAQVKAAPTCWTRSPPSTARSALR